MKIKLPFLILGVLFFGCELGDVDVTSPTLTLLDSSPIPIEAEICGSVEPVVFKLTGGDAFTFLLKCEDDVALSQYKIDIHNNFDCHGHGGGSAPSISVPNVDNVTEDWSILEITDISGTLVEESITLQTPTNITAGNYHFHVQLIDESGNDDPFANYYALKINHPLDSIVPQIFMELPSTSDMTINKGETIRFKGKVTDNRSLSDGGNGVLYLSYTDLSSGNTFTTDQAFPFDGSIMKEFDFDFEYTIPSTLVSGSYRLSLGANDGVRNVAPFVFVDLDVN